MSRGPWLERDTPSVDRNDLMQNTVGLDVRWAHRDLIVSGEAIVSEFETPDSDDLRVAAAFVQARWKLSPGVWLATRFGR